MIPEHKDMFFDYRNGLSYKEIARKYNVKLSSVQTWASRENWKDEKEVPRGSQQNQIAEFLSLSELASLYSIPESTLRDWVVKGLPSLDGKYNPIESAKWIIAWQKEKSKEDELSRLQGVKADREELKLEQDRGNLVALDEMVAAIKTILITLKSSLRGLPRNLCLVQLRDEKDPVRQMLAWENAIAAVFRYASTEIAKRFENHNFDDCKFETEAVSASEQLGIRNE